MESVIPFESRAYEALLATVIAIQNREIEKTSRRVTALLRHFKGAVIVPLKQQENMRLEKNKITATLGIVSKYRKWLDELLEDDEKLALMNLTRLRTSPLLYRYPLANEILQYHEEIEVYIYVYVCIYLYDFFCRHY
jgi:hypothetical protein